MTQPTQPTQRNLPGLAGHPSPAAWQTRHAIGVHCEGLVHIYRLDGNDVVALRGVDLDVDAGERVALLGPSGSGKSSLLNLMAGLLRPSAGVLRVGSIDVGRVSERELLQMRATSVSVVAQSAGRNLLPYASGEDNLHFAQRALNRPRRRQVPTPRELLGTLGLAHLRQERVLSMSGGEQQRLAIAAALSTGPGLLLADEPTSQVDHDSRDDVLDMLVSVNEQFGSTVVVVTHDPSVGEAMGRTISMRDGRIGAEGRHGATYAVVGADGTVQLPTDVLDLLPPGTLATLRRAESGIELTNPELAGPESVGQDRGEPGPVRDDRAGGT